MVVIAFVPSWTYWKVAVSVAMVGSMQSAWENVDDGSWKEIPAFCKEM